MKKPLFLCCLLGALAFSAQAGENNGDPVTLNGKVVRWIAPGTIFLMQSGYVDDHVKVVDGITRIQERIPPPRLDSMSRVGGYSSAGGPVFIPGYTRNHDIEHFHYERQIRERLVEIRGLVPGTIKAGDSVNGLSVRRLFTEEARGSAEAVYKVISSNTPPAKPTIKSPPAARPPAARP